MGGLLNEDIEATTNPAAAGSGNGEESAFWDFLINVFY